MKNHNIRDKFLLSIVDKNGIKQFNLHRFIKKIILYFILVIAIVMIMIFFAIKLLAIELKDIQLQKNETLNNYVDIYNKNEDLKQQIEISKNKLKSINEKMQDLEDIINTSNVHSNKKDITTFNINNLNKSQRETMLKIIPSYLPFAIEEYETLPLKNGLVFLIPFQTPIYATADGIVELTRNEDNLGIGKFVKVVHPFGFISIYGYLSKSIVKRGDIVSKGQVIGYSGKHNMDSLFYDIRFLGSKVDINTFIKWDINNFEIVFKDSVINWNSLLWTFNDIMEINNHKIFVNN